MKTRTFTKLEKELFYGIQNQGYKILDMEIYDLDTSKSYSISETITFSLFGKPVFLLIPKKYISSIKVVSAKSKL